MKLFYHHVGQLGSSDFAKTVFKEIPIALVEANIPDNNPQKKEILKTLHEKYPSGFFNCWGVPEGANFVIQNLEVGDCVFLVESVRINGRVPALCRVEAFWKIPLRGLSQALWESDKFPFIFFFRTDEINMLWADFQDSLGYKKNFDPRGKFYSVASERLTNYSSVEEYIRSMHARFSLSKKPFDVVTATDLDIELAPEERTGVGEIRSALEEIKQKSFGIEPKLKSGLSKERRETYSVPRDAAFVIAVRRLYSYRCIFCGVGLRAPNGRPEVQSAHVYPKKLDGSDDVRNGICLCRRHHWAFDVGWMAITDDYTTIIRKDVPTTSDYLFIRDLEGKRIREPLEIALAPHTMFLKEHRKLMKFEKE